MKSSQSRFEIHSRRSLLVRSVAVGALVTLPGLACGGSDEDTFSQSPAVTVDVATTDPAVDPTAAPATDTPATDPVVTDAPATDPVATEALATDAPTTGDTFPAGAELAVNFTFTAGEGRGPTRNPYIAVWVEDASGNLVKTVALWVEQSFKAEKYIHEMRSWYDLTGGDLTLSTATRVAGDYSVVWDGTDDAGNVVPQGEYTLYIEGAREHGPYEIVGQPVTIATEGFSLTIDDQGELNTMSVEYTV